MMTDLPASTCSLLWSAAAVDMNGDVLPCCRFRRGSYSVPNIKDGLASAVNSEMFEDMRQRMMSGERPDNCFKCWEQEDSTGESMRTQFNKRYERYVGSEPVMRYLETGFSTHCNLACRMCDEEYSSKWATIKGQRADIGFETHIDNFDVDFSNLTEIKVIGGEPMMARQHDEFVQKLLDNYKDLSKLVITYHTNGTVLPSATTLELWKQVKKVQLIFSIDGVGRTNEIQRPGHKWETIEDNLRVYRSLHDVNLVMGTHTTVTALNLFGLHEFYTWWDTQFESWNRCTIDTAEYPEHLNIQNMPEHRKKRATEYLTTHINNTEHRNRLIKKLQQPNQFENTEENIVQQEQLADKYFKQDIQDIL